MLRSGVRISPESPLLINKFMRIDEVTRSARDQERWDQYMDYLDRKERELERRRSGKPLGKIEKLKRDTDFRAGKELVQKTLGVLDRVNTWAARDAAKSTMKS